MYLYISKSKHLFLQELYFSIIFQTSKPAKTKSCSSLNFHDQ